MACGNSDYFVGNGSVYIRKMEDACGAPTEGWHAVGDASGLMINTSQEKNKHYESVTGQGRLAASWVTQTESTFELSINSFNAANLVALTQGTNSGAVAGASVTGEVVENAYRGEYVFVAYPGISSVAVVEDPAGTPVTLVENLDYELDTRNGGIKILDGATNLTGDGPFTLGVDYTHVGIQYAIEALTTGLSDYQIRFNGINKTKPNTPVIVTIHRAQLSPAEEISLIGDDVATFTFTGDALVDGSEHVFSIVEANAVV